MRRSALSPCVHVWRVPSSPIAVICCGTGASAWVGQVGTRCALTGRFTVKQGSGPESNRLSALLGVARRDPFGRVSPSTPPLPCAPSGEGAGRLQRPAADAGASPSAVFLVLLTHMSRGVMPRPASVDVGHIVAGLRAVPRSPSSRLSRRSGFACCCNL